MQRAVLRVVTEARPSFEPSFRTANPALRGALDEFFAMSRTDIPILLTGATGVGKTLLAHDTHTVSDRCHRPFVVVNCPSLPALLLESLFFGQLKGAFTSATCDRIGLFESGNGGTVFIDEISELSPELQAKLLRVIEEKRIMMIGSTEEKTLDVRWIFATNRDLRQLVVSGGFRQDLYFRLQGYEMEIPPLRERPEDIRLLAAHFLDVGQLSEALTEAAIEALETHIWPGNVRELQNVLKRAPFFARGGKIDVHHLRLGPSAASMLHGNSVSIPLGLTLEEAEARYIKASVDAHGGNVSSAAASLGVGRHTATKKLRRLLR